MALVRSARKLIVAKGKKFREIDMSTNPSDAELRELILGPTGNLRAPSARVGDTMLVGFNAEAYDLAGL